MPFLLYHFDSNCADTCTQVGHVKLAGYGPIYQSWKDNGQPIEEGWYLSQKELVRRVGGDSMTDRFLIDLKPNSRESVDLYEIIGIDVFVHGSRDTREAVWAPMMLHLREFWCTPCPFEDKAARDAAIHAFRVTGEGEQHDIFEFLYLQRNWTWGRNGQVNGTLLFPSALQYFMERLTQRAPVHA